MVEAATAAAAAAAIVAEAAILAEAAIAVLREAAGLVMLSSRTSLCQCLAPGSVELCLTKASKKQTYLY